MADWLAGSSALEALAVVFAILYLVLAIRQSALCWPAGLVSVALSLVLFYDARLYMESALQIFYIAISLYGWYEWKRGGTRHEGVSITLWPARMHAFCGGLIVLATVAFGAVLARTTDAALPYVDSFTTVGAIVTTWMVARKILENWIYWFVIDSVSIYLYLMRGLDLYAALFAVYLVLVVVGFRRWLLDWRAQRADGAALESG